MADLPVELPTESQPVNSTRLRRFLVLTTIKLLKCIVPSHGALIFLPNNLCIKYGPLRNLSEASATRFIAQHTSIPVPKVHCAFTRKRCTYIVTEKINGEMLGIGWVKRSDDSKAKILQQLKGMVDEMRNIPPPRRQGQRQGICNVDGGAVWDSRLAGTSMHHGPFESVHDFHHYSDVSELISRRKRNAYQPHLNFAYHRWLCGPIKSSQVGKCRFGLLRVYGRNEARLSVGLPRNIVIKQTFSEYRPSFKRHITLAIVWSLILTSGINISVPSTNLLCDMAPVSRKPLPATYAPLNQNHPSSFNYAQNDNSNHRPVDFFEMERPRRHIANPEESEMAEFGSIERLAHRTVDSPLNLHQPDSNGHDPYGYNHANGYSSQYHYRIFWHWKGEFAALLFAAALVAAMYALLISYNGRRVPDWGYSINLSTLLSLLSTVFRAIIGTVTAQVISQAKWTWYTGTQAQLLQTFQDFDSGSRGTLGSLFLIPKVIRHSLIAALGALVMVVSLAVGPFVQQAIKTTSCASPVPGATASLPYANYVPRQGIILVKDGLVDYFQISEQYIENAVLASLTGGEDITGSQLSPICSTGNCTFPIGDPFDNGTFSAESFSTIGLCSSCVDVSSLVDVFYGDNYTSTNYNYGLPDGLLLDYGYNNGDYAYGTFANIITDTSLSWLGTLLTPNLAQASRWALVNVTYLAFSSARCGDTATPECPLLTNYSTATALDTDKPAGPVAVTCALYPCIRRSLPSVINNKLSEIQLDNKIVWPVSIPAIDLSAGPILDDFEYYAEIQSPCRVNDTVYTMQNMSTAPDSTNLSLHETMLDGTVQVKNVSAPEACIYRHSVVFADILRGMLGGAQGLISVFSNSTCFTTVMYSFGLQCGYGPALGGGTWMYSLFKNGNASVSDIEGFFEGFAVAMTNSYRSTFGSVTFNETAVLQGQLLPPSREVQGIVWQDSLCTSVQWMWLLLPAVVVLLTTLLLIWTVAKGWKLRRVEPVWKDNLLPAIIYKDRFKRQDGATLEQVIEESQGGTEQQAGRLLELDEIKRIANNSMVSFHWSEDMGPVGTFNFEGPAPVGPMHEPLRRRK